MLWWTRRRRALCQPPDTGGGYKRGLAIFVFLLRLAAIVTTIVSSSIMYTAEETLPFFTQFLQFQAGYDDFATFQCRDLYHISYGCGCRNGLSCGNPNTKWLPICQQFGDFYQATSNAVVAASIGIVFFTLLITISAIASKRH
ncbi:hypothetical protein Bca4012_034027 [Brassica carinata]